MLFLFFKCFVMVNIVLFYLNRGKNGSVDDSPLGLNSRLSGGPKWYQSLPGYELLSEREKRVRICFFLSFLCIQNMLKTVKWLATV
jgi:hypothetical protein